MNYISPEILMQNAIKNKYYRKPDDIYPPTEKDFDQSIHKFVNDKRNINNQRLDEIDLESEGNIRYQDPNAIQNIQNEKQVKRMPETFYIPTDKPVIKSDEKFSIPWSINKDHEFVNIQNINPQILIIIIIVMLMVIIYLYCKVENLQTLNKIYSQNLVVKEGKT